MMNNVTLIGRLTKEPVMKQAGDATVANFTLAVDRNYSSNGKKECDFIPVVAWRKTAELIGKYCNKGTMIGVVGRVQTRTWEKDGQKFFVTEVVCNEVQFLSAPTQKNEVGEKLESEGFDEISDIQLPF